MRKYKYSILFIYEHLWGSTNYKDDGKIGWCFYYMLCSKLGEGKGNLFQYSCLENPIDRGARQAPCIHGVTRVGHNLATKPPNHIYTVGYCPAIHKNHEIFSFAATWMHLEGIIVSEISQTEKRKYCTISLKCGIFKTQQTSEYNKKKPSHRYRELTSCYQWEEGNRRDS